MGGFAHGNERASSGFSLPELLAVLALIGIALAVGIPLVNEQIRLAEVRGAAANLAVHLRAARMISVTIHDKVQFTVGVDPENSYSYVGTDGVLRKIDMPDRVRITPDSDRSITFEKNGSVDAASTIILEADVPGARDRWTANVSTMGMATLVHDRLSATP